MPLNNTYTREERKTSYRIYDLRILIRNNIKVKNNEKVKNYKKELKTLLKIIGKKYKGKGIKDL